MGYGVSIGVRNGELTHARVRITIMLTLVQCNPAKSALMMLFMTWWRKRSWLLDESMFTIRSLN
jgi:hypothetical protein